MPENTAVSLSAVDRESLDETKETASLESTEELQDLNNDESTTSASIHGTVETRLDVTPHVSPGHPRFRSYMPSSAGYKRSFPAMEALLIPRTSSSVTQGKFTYDIHTYIHTYAKLDKRRKIQLLKKGFTRCK